MQNQKNLNFTDKLLKKSVNSKDNKFVNDTTFDLDFDFSWCHGCYSCCRY